MWLLHAPKGNLLEGPPQYCQEMVLLHQSQLSVQHHSRFLGWLW